VKPKIVIGLAIAGVLLLLGWMLHLGSAAETAESAMHASAGESPPEERGTPPPAALEHEGEGVSRVAAEGAAPEATSRVPARSDAAGQRDPSAPVRGRVLDTAGKPVAGAGIFVGPFVTESGRGIRPQTPPRSPLGEGGEAGGETELPRRVGVSDEQGLFEIPQLPDGILLHARGEQYAAVLAFSWSVQTPSFVEPVLVVARPAAVAGLVTDVENRPVEGVRIAVRIPENLEESLGGNPDRSVSLEYHTVSGADGRFEIADAPGVLGRRLVAEREGATRHD